MPNKGKEYEKFEVYVQVTTVGGIEWSLHKTVLTDYGILEKKGKSWMFERIKEYVEKFSEKNTKILIIHDGIFHIYDFETYDILEVGNAE